MTPPFVDFNINAVISAAHQVLSGQKKRGGLSRRLLPFLGPAFIASMAYAGPGNFSTNIQGGAKITGLIVALNIYLVFDTLFGR